MKPNQVKYHYVTRVIFSLIITTISINLNHVVSTYQILNYDQLRALIQQHQIILPSQQQQLESQSTSNPNTPHQVIRSSGNLIGSARSDLIGPNTFIDSLSTPFSVRKGEQQPTNAGSTPNLINHQHQLINDRSTYTPAPKNPNHLNLSSNHQLIAPSGDGHLNESSRTPAKQKWFQMESAISSQASNMALDVQQTIFRLLAKTNVSEDCSRALTDFTYSLRDHQLWALQTLDSSAHHLPSGFLEGALTELGHYDQCLSITKQTESPSLSSRSQAADGKQHTTSIRGQYCTVILKPPSLQNNARNRQTTQRFQTICSMNSHLNLALNHPVSLTNPQTNESLVSLLKRSTHFQYSGLRFGLCTPSACSKFELQQLLNSYLAKWHLLGWVKSCQTQQQIQTITGLDSLQWSIIIIMSSFVFLSLIATLCDCLIWEPNRSQFGCHVKEPARGLRTNRDDTACLRRKRILHGAEGDSSHWQYEVYRSSGEDLRSRYDQFAHFHSHPEIASIHNNNNNNNIEIELKPQKNPLHPGHTSPKEQIDQEELAGKDDENSWSFHHMQSQQDHQQTEESASEIEIEIKSSRSKRVVPKKKMTRMQLIEEKHRHKQRNSSYQKHKHSNSSWLRWMSSILVCFSLIKNFRYIFAIHKRPNNEDKLPVLIVEGPPGSIVHMHAFGILNGIRSLSILWIIFGATYHANASDLLGNLSQVANITCSSRLLQALLNSGLAIDTLYLVSGILTLTGLLRRSQGQNYRQLIASAPVKSSSKTTNGTMEGFIDITSNSIITSAASSSSQLTANSSSAATTTTTSCSFGSSDNNSSYVGRGHVRKSLLNKPRHHKQDDQSAPVDPLKMVTFKPVVWLLLRYLRLTPTYLFVIGLAIVLPNLGSGPFWIEAMSQLGVSINCRSNWFFNLLYINNHLEADKLCLTHSWSLSNEMQFYLFALILFGLYYHNLKQVVLLLWVISFAASMATTHALTAINQFPPTLLATIPTSQLERVVYKQFLYNKPWPHLPSYLIGLTIGYSLIQYDKNSWLLSRGWRIFGWTLSSLVALSLVNSLYPWNLGLQVDENLTALYGSTFRSLWSLCLSWFIYELTTRPSGHLARLLSWSGFQLTNRLTYSCYLIYPFIIQFRFGLLRDRLEFTLVNLISNFVANVGLTYLAAILLALFIDSPIVQLNRLALKSLDELNISGGTIDLTKTSTGLSRRGKQQLTNDKNIKLSNKENRKQGKYDANQHLDSSWTLVLPNLLQSSPLVGENSRSNVKTTTEAKSRYPNDSMQPTKRVQIVASVRSRARKQRELAGEQHPTPRIARMSHPYKYNKTQLVDENHNSGYMPSNTILENGDVDEEIYNESMFIHNIVSPNNTHNHRILTKEPESCTPDHDFQMKLAQAIGRGFKLRNQLAMASGNCHLSTKKQNICSNSTELSAPNMVNHHFYGKSLEKVEGSSSHGINSTSDLDSNASCRLQNSWGQNRRSAKTRGQLTTFVSSQQQDEVKQKFSKLRETSTSQ